MGQHEPFPASPYRRYADVNYSSDSIASLEQQLRSEDDAPSDSLESKLSKVPSGQLPWSGITDDELLEGEVIELPDEANDLHSSRVSMRGGNIENEDTSTTLRWLRRQQSDLEENEPQHRRESLTVAHDYIQASPQQLLIPTRTRPSQAAAWLGSPSAFSEDSDRASYISQALSTATSPSIEPFGSPRIELRDSCASPRQPVSAARTRSFREAGHLRIGSPLMGRSRRTSSSSAASQFLSNFNSAKSATFAAEEGLEFVDSDGKNFVVGTTLGRGGFNAVHDAISVDDFGNKQLYAVKVFKCRRNRSTTQHERDDDHDDDDDNLDQERFHREIMLWKTFDHPYVMPLLSSNKVRGTFFSVMPKATGSLFDLLQLHRTKRGLPLNLAKKYVAELASALRYLHKDMLVVHRDVKLENCLLLPASQQDSRVDPSNLEHRLVLSDFGLADYIGKEDRSSIPFGSSSMHQSMSVTTLAGSIPYAAPELLAGLDSMETEVAYSHDSNYNPALDTWALGVVSFCLLTGKMPFANGNISLLAKDILHGSWNRDLLRAVVKVKSQHNEMHWEVANAVDMMHGLLDLHPGTRWGAGQALSCQFLKGFGP